MIYHIAICDDDKDFITYIKNILLKARADETQIFKIDEYFSGEELIKALDGNTNIDLLILDMQLGGIDGDETAKHFREKFPYSVLVFCSGVYPPTIQSFKTTPFRYLLKQQTDIDFINEMKNILTEVEKTKNNDYIIGHYRSIFVKIKINHILYIENSKRGSRLIVSKDSEAVKFSKQILIDEKLTDLTEKFRRFGFAVPHSSYIVNLNHIEIMSSNCITLDNGECLSISRAFQKQFKDFAVKYMSNKY